MTCARAAAPVARPVAVAGAGCASPCPPPELPVLLSLWCSPEADAGRTRKRHARSSAADETAGSIDAFPSPPRIKRGRFVALEKCGECKHCLNPKLKKACKVVLLQRKLAGGAWRG